MPEFTEKQIKAAKKEGGKKGQDLSGMHDMGGISYFHVAMEKCEGSLELLQHALDGANVEVDEKADDRKGGAGHLGKMFLSANNDQLAIICHVPKDRHEVVTPKEWVEVFLGMYNGKIVEEGEDFVKATVPADKDNERFPLKMRDEAMNLGYSFLAKKGLVREDEDEDDMLDGDALEAAGIEW
ncbi:flagellar associated protein [Salpingoeca rosetta]|uniref:Flagellar associated protein n=1 Tax=Salpingoeca rosetta (strain ATCC 50818 / BSB-021) TaxID=946362 RepID=F2UAT1_SALR5|nr:flagellar associated protein [Salpingoeca rosetta]EGD73497.1 flagellar associated protein [Salpingoeca rosetta]|eukprot:XP_004993779.1 flagellar associated protein [Salpingoeca rosetta]